MSQPKVYGPGHPISRKQRGIREHERLYALADRHLDADSAEANEDFILGAPAAEYNDPRDPSDMEAHMRLLESAFNFRSIHEPLEVGF
jgi:hypothetical protein